MTAQVVKRLPEFLSAESGETLWIHRDLASTRGKAGQYVASETGMLFIETLEASVRKVWMRPCTYHVLGYPSPGGTECEADHPEAEPFWRLEWPR